MLFRSHELAIGNELTVLFQDKLFPGSEYRNAVSHLRFLMNLRDGLIADKITLPLTQPMRKWSFLLTGDEPLVVPVLEALHPAVAEELMPLYVYEVGAEDDVTPSKFLQSLTPKPDDASPSDAD